LHEGSIALHSNCVISGTAPTFAGGTTKRIAGPFVFKLADSANPPKTVTLYPLNFTIVSKSEKYPFDGTWKIKQTGSGVVSCPGDAPMSEPGAGTVEYKVVDGKLFGHALSVSVTGITASVPRTYAAAGITFTEQLTFTVTGAVSSVHGSQTGTGSIAGCQAKFHETESGSRISPWSPGGVSHSSDRQRLRLKLRLVCAMSGSAHEHHAKGRANAPLRSFLSQLSSPAGSTGRAPSGPRRARA
jgi:hypothetical protein